MRRTVGQNLDWIKKCLIRSVPLCWKKTVPAKHQHQPQVLSYFTIHAAANRNSSSKVQVLRHFTIDSAAISYTTSKIQVLYIFVGEGANSLVGLEVYVPQETVVLDLTLMLG
jgi:hypothetical protein